MLAIAWICGFVWPSIQSGIDAFGHGVAGSGAAGQFAYGTLNRGLIPFGLHHVLNSYFWFGLGEFTYTQAGEAVVGDLNRFFAGDPTAGVFMTGFFPVMMFGLPGAALAMYLTAKKERPRSDWWRTVLRCPDCIPDRYHRAYRIHVYVYGSWPVCPARRPDWCLTGRGPTPWVCCTAFGFLCGSV